MDRVQFSLRNETRQPRIEGGELTLVLHGEGEKHGIRNLTEPLYAREDALRQPGDGTIHAPEGVRLQPPEPVQQRECGRIAGCCL